MMLHRSSHGQNQLRAYVNPNNLKLLMPHFAITDLVEMHISFIMGVSLLIWDKKKEICLPSILFS